MFVLKSCLEQKCDLFSLIPRPLPNFISQPFSPFFFHSCEIKSGSGLGTRLILIVCMRRKVVLNCSLKRHLKYVGQIMIFIIGLTHMNVWESVGKPYSCMEYLYLLLQVTQEPIAVLQIMCAVFEHAIKSNFYMIKSLSP